VSGQHAASRDERIRADLAELRSVLDSALSDLDRLRTLMGPELVAWENRAPRAVYLARHLDVDKAYAVGQTDADRLAIRVGQRDRLWRTYVGALGDAFSASLFTYGHRFGGKNTQEYVRRANAGNASEVAFRAEALRVAGTRLK
jgi:hypothetical protein